MATCWWTIQGGWCTLTLASCCPTRQEVRGCVWYGCVGACFRVCSVCTSVLTGQLPLAAHVSLLAVQIQSADP